MSKLTGTVPLCPSVSVTVIDTGSTVIDAGGPSVAVNEPDDVLGDTVTSLVLLLTAVNVPL